MIDHRVENLEAAWVWYRDKHIKPEANGISGIDLAYARVSFTAGATIALGQTMVRIAGGEDVAAMLMAWTKEASHTAEMIGAALGKLHTAVKQLDCDQ